MADVQMWRYVVPSNKFGEWGIFLLDSTGYFSVVSDFGNYAYLWTHHGCADFREFLVGLEKDYLCSKLGTKGTLDEKKTLQLIGEALDQAEEDGSIPEEEMVEERMILEELDSSDGVEAGFRDWSESTRLNPPWEYLCYSYPPDLLGFAEKVWPRFVELLRKDLA